jgi:prefoldin subunit 5
VLFRSPEDEAQALKAQAAALRAQLEAIDKRISELTATE